MVTVDNHSLILQELLTKVFQVQKPESIEKLAGGYSSPGIYRIFIGGKSYIMRFANPDRLLEDRERELQAMTLAAKSAVAPKIIYELGIVGIFLIIIYIYYFFKNLKKLLNNKFKSNQELFFSMVFFSIIIALFVRAASYFTPSMFIFAVSLVGMNRLRK